MRICVLVMVMSGLVMQSSQTSTGTESSLSNSSPSPGLRTCYKCYNCATFEQVQAKVCDKPEEQFCSKEIKASNGEVNRQCADKKMCEQVEAEENIFCCDSDKCNMAVLPPNSGSLPLLLSFIAVALFSSFNL